MLFLPIFRSHHRSAEPSLCFAGTPHRNPLPPSLYITPADCSIYNYEEKNHKIVILTEVHL